MRRVELYIDNDGKLTLDIFKNEEREYDVKQIKGRACYEYISKLFSKPIFDIYEKRKTDEFLCDFKNYVVNINEIDEVLSKRGTAVIKFALNDYYNKKKQKQTKLKKVKRKNKYSGKKIVAGVLTFFIIGGITSGVKSLQDSDVKLTNNDSYVSIIDDAFNFEDKYDNPEVELLYNKEEINIMIDYNDRSDTEKARLTSAYYKETIKKYAEIYGVDPNIMLAIATQERGIHSETKDSGGATGLMQIQNSVWRGQSLTAYNYQTKESETIIVNESKLSDVFYNIKVGCMIFQNTLNYMNGNLLAAIQCYNMGYGNMMKILNSYSNNINKPVDQILLDITDKGWLDHRNIIKVGDQQYLEHVLSWIGNDLDIDITNDGKVVNLNINDENEVKNMSIN